MKMSRLPRLPTLRIDRGTAMRMTFAEKFEAGGMLFDAECRIIRERIREILPDASRELELDLLRLAIRRLHGDKP